MGRRGAGRGPLKRTLSCPFWFTAKGSPPVLEPPTHFGPITPVDSAFAATGAIPFWIFPQQATPPLFFSAQAWYSASVKMLMEYVFKGIPTQHVPI